MKLTADARIRGGKLSLKHNIRFLSDIRQLKDGDYILTIERAKKKRSLMQNAYFHAMIEEFRQHLNEEGNDFTAEKLKEIVKCKFLLIDEYDKNTGSLIGQRIKGTSELTTIEFMELIEKTIQWAAEFFNIILPYPSEQLQIQIP